MPPLRFALMVIVPSAGNDATAADTLTIGDYIWSVLTWNSPCGTSASAPAVFRSSGSNAP